MMVKAKEIKAGDIFLYDNYTYVATEDYDCKYLWVTNKDCYINKKDLKKFSYGYTSVAIIKLTEEENVDIIGSCEDELL